MIPKRAETTAQKALILKALLDIWDANPDLRLGQMFFTGLYRPPHLDLFSIEDADLIGELLASEYLNCPE